jgi:serine/threonine protein kinase
MESSQPTSIGKYRILSVIGHGGMGVVYRAQDPLMGRQVAIKTVTEFFSKDPAMLQRFYGEAEKMGMLRHPNIITVYDLGEQDGFPYIVMEFVEGDPLDRLIQRSQSVPIYSKLRVMEQVCGALAYAHQNNVVHRDVKPGNVIVRPDGVAKLLDFGIARQEKAGLDRNLTITGSVIGTVPYMAPERLKGAAFDGRSDIFAAGILLFQFLTGTLPFTGTEYVLVNQLLNEKHPPLGNFLQNYPLGLDAILDRSLAKEPADRYQSADEMATDLYSIVESLKQEFTEDLIRQAQDLFSKGEYLGAKDLLIQLLKLDSKHTLARKMAREIDLRLTEKVRADQAKVKQLEAQAAVRDRRLDDAIRLLDDALNLVPGDQSIVSQAEAVRAKKQTSEQIFGYLQQAEAARSRGDYTGAQAIVEKAIQLDTNNSRLRAAYQSLVRQAEDAARQAKLKELLDSAGNALQKQDFEEAMDFVHKAQSIEPDNLEAKELEQAVNEGIAQQKRWRLLEDLELQMSTAYTREDVERVSLLIREALEKIPTDATLLRYQTQIDRMLYEHQTRSLVDQTLRDCSLILESNPLEALEKVRAVLLEVPPDPRLMSLEARIQQRIEHMSVEESRAAVLMKAREALQQRKFAAAIQVLEACKPPVLIPEISELLEYSRQQLWQDERQQLIVRSYSEAQALQRQEKYEDIIRLLEPIQQINNDPRLKGMLDQAQTFVERRKQEKGDALERIAPFAESGAHEQVIAMIQSLPLSVSNSVEVQTLLKTSLAAWKEEWRGFEQLGCAYSALDTLNPDAMCFDMAQAGSEVLIQLSAVLARRRQEKVDQILIAQMKQVENAATGGMQFDHARQLTDNRKLLPYASKAVEEEWIALAGQYTGTKFDKLRAKLAKSHK